MKIVVLSSVYPSRYASEGVTPVVHYFAKEWSLSGNQVSVFHNESVFPRFYYLLGNAFGKALYSRLGFPVPSKAPKRYDEIKDGVPISHLLIKKTFPHTRFSKRQLRKIVRFISDRIKTDGAPDCIVGHWDNPQLELLCSLKSIFHCPTCLVFHNNDFRAIIKRYKGETISLITSIDLVGFRSLSSQKAFERQLFVHPRTFIAASGVSQLFLDKGMELIRSFDKINSFVFVGSLIERKKPLTVLEALEKSFGSLSFSITFIGDGEQKGRISDYVSQSNCCGEVHLAGRLPRNEIVEYLIRSDVFVMVSKNEVFGLVYLEAMALGCITIASRGEGMDGIIIDGVNGFLCNAGDSQMLAELISRIRLMDSDQLKRISLSAQKTAARYSDLNSASSYLSELKSLVK